jgi:hypothetical protein
MSFPTPSINTASGGDSLLTAFDDKVDAHFADASQHQPKQIIPLRREGVLAVGNGPGVPTPFAFTITDIESSLDAAPTTTSVVAHVWKNGTNVQTITFAATETTDSLSGLSIAFARGDKFAIRINSVDSGGTAAGLSVALGVKFT